MNNINIRQNEEKNLRYLFGKQYYYDLSSNLFLASFVIIVLNVIILIVNKQMGMYINNDFLMLMDFTMFILTIICEILKKTSEKYAKKASDYLDLFDSNVFNYKRVSSTSKITLENDLDEIIAHQKELFNKRCSKDGDEEGYRYKDWYENIPTEKSKKEIIMYCQRQCLLWSKPIFICSLCLLTFLLLCVLIILFITFKNITLGEAIHGCVINVAIIVNIVRCMITQVKKVYFAEIYKNKIDDLLQDEKNTAFIDMVKDIHSYRCIPSLSLKFLYFKVYKKKHIEKD